MKKLLILIILAAVIFAAVNFFLIVPRYIVPILMYHEIGQGEGSFYVSLDNFNKQMEYIKNKGYEVISLDSLVESIKSNKRLKRNKVVITFDDGYKNNFTYASPVLMKMGFPATIFLITDFMGKKFEDSGKEFMTWEEIVTMSDNGISFGRHTKSHVKLGLINDEELAFKEISSSKKAIEAKIGKPVDYFCYPAGSFNEKIKELVKKAGYKGACTTNRGFVKYNRDVYQLKRIKVTNSDTNKPFSFWAKLSGYYTIFKKDKNPY